MLFYKCKEKNRRPTYIPHLFTNEITKTSIMSDDQDYSSSLTDVLHIKSEYIKKINTGNQKVKLSFTCHFIRYCLLNLSLVLSFSLFLKFLSFRFRHIFRTQSSLARMYKLKIELPLTVFINKVTGKYLTGGAYTVKCRCTQ